MTWTVIARQNGEGHVLSYDTEMDAVLGALGMAVTGYRTWTARVDDRGVEYLEDVESVDDLPPGWALCLTCQRGWNDEKSTSVTPAPSARCPFEYEHEEGDDMTTENAHSQVPRFRGPFATRRLTRWARNQAELARLQRLMDENDARLAELREAQKCRWCEDADA